MPNLANNLLQHYLALPAAAPANAFAIGKQYDFQLIYEHSAQGLAVSNPAKNAVYSKAVVKMPGLGIPSSEASVDRSRQSSAVC